MALGAQPRDVMGNVVRESVTLAIARDGDRSAGCIDSWPVLVVVVVWCRSRRSVDVFGDGGACCYDCSSVLAYDPARRAAQCKRPVMALRSE